MNNIMEKLKTTRILGAVGIAGLILGVIMPYAKYTFFGYTYKITLWNYWEGVVIMLLAIANLLFIFKDFVEKWIPSLFENAMGRKIKELNNPKYSLVPTVLIAIFAIYLTVQLGVEQFKYYNIGFYSMWIGTLSLVAYAFLHKENDEYGMKM